MECLEASDGSFDGTDNFRNDAAPSGAMECLKASDGSFDGTDNFRNDAAFVENFLLDDLDSYMEDINNRLIISRMVSDSVIKGMVGAISEEAAEKVASKEVELLDSNEKLHFYESNMHVEKEAGLGLAVKSNSEKLGSQLRFHDLGLEQNHTEEHLINLKIAAEEQIQRLKKEVEDVKGCVSISTANLGSSQQGKMLENGIEINKSIDALQSILEAVYKQINNLVNFSKTLLYERQWEFEFRDEVDGIVFQSFIGCLKEEFEETSHEQSHLFGNQHKNLMIKVDELSSLRQELDAISRSLFTPEPGKLSSHGSHEFVEEWSNIERKDRIHRKVLENHPPPLKGENGATASEKSKESKSTMPDETELALQHMSKDKLINYFKDEMTKMKRNHESILQEKTEQYYRLKREYLKEKDSPNWRKEKEFDALRKKIPEVIIKLDDIIVENEKSSVVCDVDECVNSLKVRADNLLFENKRLRSMLMDKRKEVKCLSLKVSDAADKMSNLSLAEENFSKQIKKLKCDIEDANVEVCIREEVYKSILRELIGRTKCDMGNVDIETIFTHEICTIVFRESLKDAKAAISDMMMRYNKEKEKRINLEALLLLTQENPLHVISLISNCCQSSPLEKLIPRNTLNKLKLFVFSSHRCHRSSQERVRDIYFWRCSPIMSFTNMASPSMNMYCDGHLMRAMKGFAFPVFSSVLSLRDEPLKLCRRVVSRGNIICSAAPESSTATVAETKEATKVESEAPPVKLKRVAPAKSPAKPLPQMMEEDVIPSLTAILEAQEDLSQIELCYRDNTLEGSFLRNGITYCFWAFFPNGVLTGPKGFSLSSYGSGPSTIEPFLIDEKKITGKHVVFWVEKRLAAQGILPLLKE